MRPGPSAFARPDCAQQCPGAGMHGGPCGTCEMGTNPGRTHRFYTGAAVLPFGYALSYTRWSYAAAASISGPISLAPVRGVLERTQAAGRTFPSSDMLEAAEPPVSFEVNVTNLGDMPADDVVLGFMVPPSAGKDGVPLQTLFGFERVHVPAGATVLVSLYPEHTEFMTTLVDGSKRVAAGEYTVRIGVQETAAHGQGYAELRLSTY